MSQSDAVSEVAYGHHDCRRVAHWQDALEAIAEDDRARRELIWLRAAERGDRDSMRDLETTDPEVRRRLHWALRRIPESTSLRDRRATLKHLQDECFAFHARRLSPVACRCPACAGTSPPGSGGGSRTQK